MLEALKKFLGDPSTEDVADEPNVDPIKLAEAALMYHVIAVDGIIQDAERERMREILLQNFGLGKEEADHLLEEARNAENEAIDLYTFTSKLKNSFPEEDRASIIEHLWEMVFADGVVHELEDNVVWRVAELLGVDTRDRMAMKRRVWKRRSEMDADDQ